MGGNGPVGIPNNTREWNSQGGNLSRRQQRPLDVDNLALEDSAAFEYVLCHVALSGVIAILLHSPEAL